MLAAECRSCRLINDRGNGILKARRPVYNDAKTAVRSQEMLPGRAGTDTGKKAVRKFRGFDKSRWTHDCPFVSTSDRSHCCVTVSTHKLRDLFPPSPNIPCSSELETAVSGFANRRTPREIERYARAFLFLLFFLFFFFLLLSPCSCLIRGYFYPICPLYRICWDRTGPWLVSHW